MGSWSASRKKQNKTTPPPTHTHTQSVVFSWSSDLLSRNCKFTNYIRDNKIRSRSQGWYHTMFLICNVSPQTGMHILHNNEIRASCGYQFLEWLWLHMHTCQVSVGFIPTSTQNTLLYMLWLSFMFVSDDAQLLLSETIAMNHTSLELVAFQLQFRSVSALISCYKCCKIF